MVVPLFKFYEIHLNLLKSNYCENSVKNQLTTPADLILTRIYMNQKDLLCQKVK